MRERPILFSAPMVRALLAGRKTQTRRVAPFLTMAQRVNLAKESGLWCSFNSSGGVLTCDDKDVRCPYGVPGDRLWVKETWRGPLEYDHDKPNDIDPGSDIRYEADGVARFYRDTESFYDQPANAEDGFGKVRTPIFMPKWASRIDLEVTAVRVERLQDISTADIEAEGAIQQRAPGFYVSAMDGKSHPTPINLWCQGWDSINGKRAPWASNPWVWVVEFRVAKGA